MIARLPKALRTALIVAAGRFSRPERHEVTAVSRALRKDRRAQARRTAVPRRVRYPRRSELAVFTAPPRLETPQARSASSAKPGLATSAKEGFTRLHFFYDSCAACAELNYAKRFQTAPLDGMAAVITGARLKIGYQASLMMLSAGASVVATTRFPHDAARRYSRRRISPELERPAAHPRPGPAALALGRDLLPLPRLDLPGLHILVNNAAQTVRRPRPSTPILLEYETPPHEALPRGARRVLSSHRSLLSMLGAASPRSPVPPWKQTPRAWPSVARRHPRRRPARSRCPLPAQIRLRRRRVGRTSSRKAAPTRTFSRWTCAK